MYVKYLLFCFKNVLVLFTHVIIKQFSKGRTIIRGKLILEIEVQGKHDLTNILRATNKKLRYVIYIAKFILQIHSKSNTL